jgi:hypothetical protein
VVYRTLLPFFFAEGVGVLPTASWVTVSTVPYAVSVTGTVEKDEIATSAATTVPIISQGSYLTNEKFGSSPNCINNSTFEEKVNNIQRILVVVNSIYSYI